MKLADQFVVFQDMSLYSPDTRYGEVCGVGGADRLESGHHYYEFKLFMLLSNAHNKRTFFFYQTS